MLTEPLEKELTAKGSKRQEAESYLLNKYEFIFNEIKGIPEYRPLGTYQPFKTMDDYKLNSIARELDIFGINIGAAKIKEILSSNFNPKINPLHKYFQELPDPGNQDWIKKMADTVTTANNDFYPYFKKWIVAAVAGCMDAKVVNHTAIVFTGDIQGQYKTTWLNNLIPEKIIDYGFCGEIKPDDKDTLNLLAENLIINIDDQIHKLNKKDENALKNLITAPYVKYRRPYDKYIIRYERYASIVASINQDEFLADVTGSRRFLPFKILKIDINAAKAIDINKVWAQAFKLYESDFIYWFDSTEVSQLKERNQMFNIISTEEQLLLEFYDFEAPDEVKSSLQPATILSKLENHTKQKLSAKKIGEALKKHNIEKQQKTISGTVRWIYHIAERSRLSL